MEGDGLTGSMVIREYLKLKARLESKLLSASTTSPLYPMHYAMLTRVKKYLAEATSSHALLMATMLHPSWRGHFLTQGFGPQSPVTKKASRILEDPFYDRKHRLETTSPASAPRPEPNISAECNEDSYDPMLHLNDAQKRTSTIDKLAEYQLGCYAPSEDVAMNPKLTLKWWQSHASKYPILSTLACQYLAVSGSSAAVEQTFSSAADVCTTDRGKLAPKSIERCVSSRIWIANGVPLDSGFEEAYQAMQNCITFDVAARLQCVNKAHFPGD